jgi:hypothetical protein
VRLPDRIRCTIQFFHGQIKMGLFPGTGNNCRYQARSRLFSNPDVKWLPMFGKNAADRRRYLEILRRMTPQQRLAKAMELSEFGKSLLLTGLRQRFPELNEAHIHEIYLRRLEQCHNRNY